MPLTWSCWGIWAPQHPNDEVIPWELKDEQPVIQTDYHIHHTATKTTIRYNSSEVLIAYEVNGSEKPVVKMQKTQTQELGLM